MSKEQQAVSNAVKQAKRRMGAGWDIISPELRKAMVCEAVLGQIASMDDETVSADICARIITIAAETMRGDY